MAKVKDLKTKEIHIVNDGLAKKLKLKIQKGDTLCGLKVNDNFIDAGATLAEVVCKKCRKVWLSNA